VYDYDKSNARKISKYIDRLRKKILTWRLLLKFIEQEVDHFNLLSRHIERGTPIYMEYLVLCTLIQVGQRTKILHSSSRGAQEHQVSSSMGFQADA